MPIIPGRKRTPQLVTAHGQTIEAGIDRRLGEAAHYTVLRQEIAGVTGRTAISLVTYPGHQRAGRASLYEINAVALLGDDEDSQLVVGRYFMNANGNPVLQSGNPLNRAYRIGQAERILVAGKGQWQKVYGAYTDSQLIEDSSLQDMKEGLWAGIGPHTQDALANAEASLRIKRAIDVGHSALYGIDLAEPHFQGALYHIASQAELAS